MQQSPDQLEPSSCGGSLLTAAEEVVRPYLTRWPKLDRNAIVQGWAGVYSSFLLHAERAADRYRVPAHEILAQCGERGLVGGQEDMIINVALELAHSGADLPTCASSAARARCLRSRSWRGWARVVWFGQLRGCPEDAGVV